MRNKYICRNKTGYKNILRVIILTAVIVLAFAAVTAFASEKPYQKRMEAAIEKIKSIDPNIAALPDNVFVNIGTIEPSGKVILTPVQERSQVTFTLISRNEDSAHGVLNDHGDKQDIHSTESLGRQTLMLGNDIIRDAWEYKVAGKDNTKMTLDVFVSGKIVKLTTPDRRSYFFSSLGKIREKLREREQADASSDADVDANAEMLRTLDGTTRVGDTEIINNNWRGGCGNLDSTYSFTINSIGNESYEVADEYKTDLETWNGTYTGFLDHTTGVISCTGKREAHDLSDPEYDIISTQNAYFNLRLGPDGKPEFEATGFNGWNRMNEWTPN